MATNRTDDEVKARPRGFARLTPDQRRSLGSKGGKTAHERGTANKFTSDGASRAGRIAHARGTAHHWTSEQAREAGRKGGAAARKTRAVRDSETNDGGEERDVMRDDEETVVRKSDPMEVA